jgi:thiosulfate/3-mercaptopyruvate sulfurtransferase
VTEAFGPLVSPEWLAEHIADANLRVIDFRWYLDGRDGRRAYLEGHIPTAVFVEMADVSGETGPGRHPLPSADRFTAAMRAAGVSSGTRVVVYDDTSGSTAARLWWLLRHFGHAAVAVLDGGLQAWPGNLDTTAAVDRPGDFSPSSPLDAGVLDHRAVQGRDPATVLIDARVGERYRGEVEPVDSRAGHIPGAISVPWKSNIGPDGRLLPPDELRERYAAVGAHDGSQVVAYCGSGVNACHDLLAMELAGLTGGRLYEGSWSDWSSRAELPGATGPEP